VRRIAAALAVCISVVSFCALAQGKGSTFLPAPSYPKSTLAINLVGHPKAGKVITLVIAGSNAPFEIGGPGSGSYLAYQLDAFAQNARVVPKCPRSFAEEFQNEINLGITQIATGLNEGFYGRFRIPVRVQTSRSIRHIVVCAYSRLIEDDAVVSALGFTLRR